MAAEKTESNGNGAHAGRRWQFVRIWPGEYLSPAEEGLVLVGTLKKAQDIGKSVALLNRVQPLPALRHLKRVRHVGESLGQKRTAEIIVSRAAADHSVDQEVPTHLVLTASEESPLLELLQPALIVRRVSLTRPLTQQHVTASQRLWPTITPNPLVCLDTHGLPAAEEAVLGDFLELLTEEDGEGGRTCAGNSVIIADGRSAHCSLIRGAKSVPASPLDHPVLHALGMMAASQRQSVKKEKAALPAEEGDAGSYLCTGLTAVLAREPCIMCAMALVHGRIGRIVFRQAGAGDGGVLSVYKLQALKQLNHRFTVFHAQPRPS
ncbi:probable inactive tRNA-specific adenosine deaminase-like protein 3 [Paramacrobiotus metropolitanus]|uniref:probable inactive tRNA-specific adenosine deaminase-like protein 3 n=1 Tax=Paramacrobiotus metropolitanus TaxID=2943436 RepID=UPI0024459C92|nr:probable inactive tRNA-specific adenosine deaminase-like protein 3 [Paramacrobiotus metropolitanus]